MDCLVPLPWTPPLLCQTIVDKTYPTISCDWKSFCVMRPSKALLHLKLIVFFMDQINVVRCICSKTTFRRLPLLSIELTIFLLPIQVAIFRRPLCWPFFTRVIYEVVIVSNVQGLWGDRMTIFVKMIKSGTPLIANRQSDSKIDPITTLWQVNKLFHFVIGRLIVCFTRPEYRSWWLVIKVLIYYIQWVH